MDIFGEALLAFKNGNRSTFYLKDEKGEKHLYNLAERFRPYSKLNKSEKKLVSLSHGDILDVGCGTGNIIPTLNKRGSVVGIDISPRVIEVAKKNGCNNCIVANIFSYKPNRKFDTITFFGNNLGIGGTVDKTEKLLQNLKHLLKRDGQILAITHNYNAGNYKEMILTPIWKNRHGSKFDWLIFNNNFLSKLCLEQNLKLQVISTSWKYRLVRIRKV